MSITSRKPVWVALLWAVYEELEGTGDIGVEADLAKWWSSTSLELYPAQTMAGGQQARVWERLAPGDQRVNGFSRLTSVEANQ